LQVRTLPSTATRFGQLAQAANCLAANLASLNRKKEVFRDCAMDFTTAEAD
jgi:hypothetical protein